MLKRLWEWLSRLWRRPEPTPLPETRELLEQGRAVLREWAYNKLRNDITTSLQNEVK